ncbi:Beta-ketoacyl synthase, N-terminal domain [Chitinophaga sp. CF418]|nr:Beta-ketoacyl synthase, N-terminal domain [Chitinophaga sp. CF418]
MYNGEAYITGSCVIRKNRVYRDGTLLWETPQAQELQEFLRAGYDQFSGQYPKFHKMDPLSKLGWLAAEVLLKDAPLNNYPPESIGLILANKSASLDTDLRYFDTVKDIASPALFVYTLANIVMGEISIRHGFKGENAFFTADAFDPEFMVGYISQLFLENAVSACLCGWVEVMGPAYEVILYKVERSSGGLAFNADNLQKAVSF